MYPLSTKYKLPIFFAISEIFVLDRNSSGSPSNLTQMYFQFGFCLMGSNLVYHFCKIKNPLPLTHGLVLIFSTSFEDMKWNPNHPFNKTLTLGWYPFLINPFFNLGSCHFYVIPLSHQDSFLQPYHIVPISIKAIMIFIFPLFLWQVFPSSFQQVDNLHVCLELHS